MPWLSTTSWPTRHVLQCPPGRWLLGVGALKRLDESHAEVESLHTSEFAGEASDGRIVGTSAVAADRRYQRVSRETGTMDAFVPARSLYTKVGFEPCPPFAEYTVNPYSACMTIDLAYAGRLGPRRLRYRRKRVRSADLPLVDAHRGRGGSDVAVDGRAKIIDRRPGLRSTMRPRCRAGTVMVRTISRRRARAPIAELAESVPTVADPGTAVGQEDPAGRIDPPSHPVNEGPAGRVRDLTLSASSTTWLGTPLQRNSGAVPLLSQVCSLGIPLPSSKSGLVRSMSLRCVARPLLGHCYHARGSRDTPNHASAFMLGAHRLPSGLQ